MLERLTTEKRNPASMDLDELSTLEIIRLMNKEDINVVCAVKRELENVEKVIKKTVECLKKNGRLIYVGAGTSGRIGLLDAVECPPTFSMEPEKVVGVLAGGTDQMCAKEEQEDNYELGQADMKKLKINKNDIIIGLAASGRTPYVIGAIDYANSINAATASIACNRNAEISKHAQLSVELDNGPEILTGSTRLKAGTSQKMVCNMISTASMIALGKVYENLMVDVDVSNEKLYSRWLNIVMCITGCTVEKAEEVYELSHHNAKIAICMIKLGYNYEQASELLAGEYVSVKQVLKNVQKQ